MPPPPSTISSGFEILATGFRVVSRRGEKRAPGAALSAEQDAGTPRLCLAFVAEAREFLSRNPELRHSWTVSADQSRCALTFPPAAPNGFPVQVRVYAWEITVAAGAIREFFVLEDDAAPPVANALELVRDLLSPAMRLRELSSNGTVYRWELELNQNGVWSLEGAKGLLFWNYFGKRSERILQNSSLSRP